MCVVPLGDVVASLAVTVPAPSLRKVTMRGSPPGSSVASSLSPTKVRVAGAVGPGEPDAAALGLAAAVVGLASAVASGDGDALSIGVRVAPADGDPIAIGTGLGDAVAVPLRPTMISSVTAMTSTSRPVRPVTTVRRFRSLIGSDQACVRASYPTAAVTPPGGPSSNTRRRAIMAG